MEVRKLQDGIVSTAEKLAVHAESLPAFSGIKLTHIKRVVAELLQLIGRDGIYDQYTRHDISHVNEMLHMLDWIVPETTKGVMTPADWMMIVLSVYFHDLGMLVTKKEYDERDRTDFPEFRDKVLFGEPYGLDYREKVSRMGEGQMERFLYQEFVREHHTQRIRRWIVGDVARDLGVADNQAEQVTNLLREVDPLFRRDLALICESHHKDDLDDLSKYKLVQPYGNSDAETVNLQYGAVLLRTADLLHMTRDRTPSVMFRTVTPTDPTSLREWAKQMAVRRVKAAVALDKDGQPDDTLPRDTVEVYAHFKSEEGFFGLTAYLEYVRQQLQQSHRWIEASRKMAPKYVFPWKYISEESIETDGFLKRAFRFELDHTKILDLLTGHTLYNDVKVAVRELLQNALDATRLRAVLSSQERKPYVGRILVEWNSNTRTLTVTDNGTGMSQVSIEEHFLRVGSSQYQDERFQRKHPNFSPISRFGIGVLSAFMVADSVDVLTVHPDDDEGRHLSLRTVHGKYLVRLLPKRSEDPIREIIPHGTQVRLSIRPSVPIADLLAEVKKWVVVPGCKVEVRIDDRVPVEVGFESPKRALEAWLEQDLGYALGDNVGRKVEERTVGGVTVAYALERSEYFREWHFMRLPRPRREDAQVVRPIGTCIEGIRVESHTPGFEGFPFVALANARGRGAPRTNVARSGLERTTELDLMLSQVYRIYCDHVAEELSSLVNKRGFSLTWATHESKYYLSPLLERSREQDNRVRAVNEPLLTGAVSRLPTLLVEQGGERSASSVQEVKGLDSFWTIDSEFTRFAELLVKEATAPTSLTLISRAVHGESFPVPDGVVLSGNLDTTDLHHLVFEGREVDSIHAHKNLRRVDLRWVNRSTPSRWACLPSELLRLLAREGSHSRAFRYGMEAAQPSSLFIGVGNITTSGLDGDIGVRSKDATYLLPGSDLSCMLLSILASCTEKLSLDGAMAAYLAFSVVHQYLMYPATKHLNGLLRDRDYGLAGDSEIVGKYFDLTEFEKVLARTTSAPYNPSAWRRTDKK